MLPSRLLPLIAGAAVSVLAVSACGSDDTTDSAADTTTTTATDSGASGSDGATATTDTGSDDATASSGAESDGGYRDGDYSAEGTYQSPGGSESIGLQLTLEDGTVTKLTVTSQATHPNSKKFQGQFISGIDALAVGKPIDELEVDKVSGSSLTGGGFNAAIETIKAEAAV